MTTSNRLLADSSVLSPIASAPAASPNPSTAAALMLVGPVAGVGRWGFGRRDTVGG